MDKSVPKEKVFTEAMYDSGDCASLTDFLKHVKQGEPWSIPTALLLKLNGNYRRGKYVIDSIDKQLQKRGLLCSPPLSNADYYGNVVISDPRDEFARSTVATSLPLSTFMSQKEDLIYGSESASISTIKTKMLSFDISQVPILSSNKKEIHGVVTWKKLALFEGDPTSATASEVMISPGHVAKSGDDFLQYVNTIIQQGFVFYRDPAGEVTGVITASDLARAFDSSSRTYIELQELENRIRVLLDRSPIPELQKHLAPNRKGKKIFRGATDMQFGEYLDALKDPEIWKNTKIQFDKDTFLKFLEKANKARNNTMHFSPNINDGSDEDKDRIAVDRALRIIREVPLS